MKALVVSGGGSKGAFAGGVSEFLIDQCGRNYDLFVGTSTGSLLVPLLASNNLIAAKKVFTEVKLSDIFKISPFIIKKKNGIFSSSINHWGIIKMFFNREKTFGDSRNLLSYIKKNFTEKDFNNIQKLGKEVIVTVSNLTDECVEYKSSRNCDYTEFCHWIWASANILPFMSLYIHNQKEYGDGGFGNLIPIQKAINSGATWIDIIALRPSEKNPTPYKTSNAFALINRTFDFMLNQIGIDDLHIGKLEAKQHQVDLHFYHTPHILTDQTFVFDKELLQSWWEKGFKIAETTTPRKDCLLASKE